jgi:FkbM family methyltransferase
MTFISYAQNFEDIMLWRALKHVENGFYIDVGAWSPDIDSVTKAFYENGWRGINIEPNPAFNDQLIYRRPRDTNLKVAIGNAEGALMMNFLENPGLSTLDDAIAERHKAAGWAATRQEVQIRTLSAICRDHVPKGQAVHFLKVDVEGFEEAALRGNDWATCRPWIIVVEATLPMSQKESHESWEPILFAANYQLAYADGLNRFYVAQEHADLLPAFKYPPNVFDSFKLQAHQEAETRSVQAEAKAQQAEAKAQQAEAKAQQAEAKAQQAEAKAQQAEAKAQQAEAKAQQAEAKAQQAEAKAQQAEAKAQQAEAKAQQAEAKAQQAEAKAQQAEAASTQALMQLQAVYTSTSWRITAPLRGLAGQAFKLSPQRLKPQIKLLLRHAALYVYRRPRLRNAAFAVLNRFPTLKRRLVSLITSTPVPTTNQQNGPAELAQLTPRARQIYADLKAAIEARNKDGR